MQLHIKLILLHDKQKPPSCDVSLEVLFELKILASSYFCVGLPLNYRGRSSVSPLSSGRVQCGSTAQ